MILDYSTVTRCKDATYKNSFMKIMKGKGVLADEELDIILEGLLFLVLLSLLKRPNESPL